MLLKRSENPEILFLLSNHVYFVSLKSYDFVITIAKKLSEDISKDVIRGVCVRAHYFVNETEKESEGQDLIGTALKRV